ncbi:MAG: homoserine O-acetyltransferase [Candidatus Omnitrophota bacterium]
MKENALGLVKAQEFTFAGSGEGFKLECGESFSPVTLAYEAYGQLNRDKTNAILIAHALSGDAHAAGLADGENRAGWWDNMIGPGKAFDTDKYFIICSNVLGGCRGSSGPSSINPKTRKPYGLSFPSVTIRDMVNAQKELIDYLGIDKLLSVAGGSMGGMQVLTWLAAYPGRLQSAIPIATTLKHSPQQIAFNEVGRQAIIADPCWRNGDYYGSAPPAKGLSLARMIGHITYMSDQSMEKKFGRIKKKDARPFKFTADFEVEGYLHYRGGNFVKRFDANSYLYISKAMDNFNLLDGRTLQGLFKGVKARLLVIAFKSDWLYPSYQSKEIIKAAKLAGLESTYCEVDSTYGHDAFLLETKEETHLIRHFLKKVFYSIQVR